MHTFRRAQFVPRPLDEVFAFFSNAANLEALTPPWLRFRMLTPLPIEMRAGAIIDYRLTVRALPITWKTEIIDWEPNQRFVDIQRKGPYRTWVHTHSFERHNGGTAITDDIEYQLPFGLLGRIANTLVVQGDLKRIFGYRQLRIAEIFTSPER
jgi:ligand-binding SRPBCC domain-containing protein